MPSTIQIIICFDNQMYNIHSLLGIEAQETNFKLETMPYHNPSTKSYTVYPSLLIARKRYLDKCGKR